MPAPSTIVTFYDADGDEFPVRIFTASHWRPTLLLAARKEFETLVAEGEFRPTYPLRPDTKVERHNQII